MASFLEEAGASGALAPIDQDGEDEFVPAAARPSRSASARRGRKATPSKTKSATAKRRRPPAASIWIPTVKT